MRRQWSAAAAAMVVVGLAAVTAPGAGGQPAPPTADAAPGPEGVVSAEFDAFALRVQYDVPLPVGSGSAPHVVGEVRRSGAGENSKGLAAWPTHHDPVVGGTYADPDKSRKGDERALPQVECFFPGQLLDTAFAYPTDTQAETAAAPPIGSATASCGSGPITELHATGGPVELPAIHVDAVAADALARPLERRIEVTAAARASGIVLAGGALTIGGVDAAGSSATTGEPGGAETAARVTVTDIAAGPVRFSLADDRMLVAGQDVPLGSDEARAVVAAANGALAPAGCSLTVMTDPAQFPQGFLFSRPAPFIGVRPDGTAAGSMRSGLQVLCDIPRAVSEPTGFNPQRMQVVVGFAFSGVAATAEPGGFGLGDLLDDFVADPLPDASVDVGLPLAFTEAAAPAAPATPPQAPHPSEEGGETALVAVDLPVAMGRATRLALLLLCALGWAALTHIGIRRLRGVTTP